MTSPTEPSTPFRALAVAWLALTVSFSQGCLVWRYPTTPEVRGTVIDQATQQPLPGAVVGMHLQDQVIAYTDSDGTFRLPSDRHWRFCPLIPGDYWPRGTLFIEANGYHRHEQEVRALGGNPVVLKNPVELVRAPQP